MITSTSEPAMITAPVGRCNPAKSISPPFRPLLVSGFHNCFQIANEAIRVLVSEVDVAGVRLDVQRRVTAPDVSRIRAEALHAPAAELRERMNFFRIETPDLRKGNPPQTNADRKYVNAGVGEAIDKAAPCPERGYEQRPGNQRQHNVHDQRLSALCR